MINLIVMIIPKASLYFTYIVYTIGVITIIYASLSTLRTTDIKELIAYSSVCHAAVYLLGVFSNNIQGIEGSIILGLAHGFASSALFICAGGVLYDRTGTRLISFYRGMTQVMPLFALLYFIFSLANAGVPLTLNFVGEFLCLYGAVERLPLLGGLACSSIVFSAAYTIYMYNRIAFGGAYSSYLHINLPDLSKRECIALITLALPTIMLGIFPQPILTGLHYAVSTLIYSVAL
jgi:NADH-ubiquinone oxidoreductase chain 4